MTVAGNTGGPITNVTVNELSTVACAYAFAQFLKGSSLAGPALSLQIAVATARNLISPSTGTASTIASAPNGSATEALATFNTVAGLLASCTQNASLCGTLFTQAAPLPDGTAAGDTLQAAQNIALAPGQNVAALFALLPSTSPYTPKLAVAPNAWTIALEFSPVYAPGRFAFDANGNIWVAQNFNPGTTAPSRQITVLDDAGAPTFGSPISGNGIDGSLYGVAVDPSGQVWFANTAGNSLSGFTASGQPAAGSPYTSGSLSQPQGIAVDESGNVWVANFENETLTEFPEGNFVSPFVFSGGGLNGPAAIAIDAGGTAWVSDSTTDAVSAFAAGGSPQPFSPVTGGGLSQPEGIAIDSAGNAWVANFTGRSLTLIGNSGAIRSPSPITAGSLLEPWGDAIDGNDNVWVANFGGGNVTEICGTRGTGCPAGAGLGASISPSSGYTSAALEHLTAVQIDSAGNVWVCNNIAAGTSLGKGTPGNGLVEFIGLAGPVKTPLIGPPVSP
jgi:streptogramin lyase